MDKLSLEELVNKRFIKFTVILFVMFITITISAFYVFHFYIYERELKDVENDINNFFTDFNNEIYYFEESYQMIAEKQLRDIYEIYLNDPNPDLTSIKNKIAKEFSNVDIIGPSLNQTHYYIINQQGLVIDTNYQRDMGLNLSMFTEFWSKLENLKPGEMFLPSIDDETRTGKLRLYSYIKLPDGKIYEIGLNFKNIEEYILNSLRRIVSNTNTNFILISSDFKPFFNTNYSVTEKDKFFFEQSLNQNSVIKESSGFLKNTYYKGWQSNNSSYNNRFIKIIVNHRTLKILLISLILFFLLNLSFFYFFRRDLKDVIKEISNPVITLSKTMSSFDTDQVIKEKELGLPKSKIKEIDRINESYLNMVDEIKASYEQLAAYNEKLMAMNDELEESYQELEEQNNRFNKLINLITHHHSENRDNDIFLSNLLNTAVEIIPEADYGSVYTYENNKVNYIDAIGFDLEKLQNMDLPAENFHKSNETIESVNDFKELNNKMSKKKEIKQLESTLDMIKETIFCDLTVKGEKRAGISLDIASVSDENFTESSKKVFEAFQNVATSFFELKEYNKLQGQFTKELISSIIRLLEMHDQYTRGHSENVAKTSAEIAEQMGLSKDEIKDVYWAGMVHDIGKLIVPLKILNKDGLLSENEYELVKNHPYWGYKALNDSEALKPIAKYVLYHHERWDGKGYPEGIKEDEIPIISQILSVTDAWDAMTSNRSYRAPLSKEEAFKELKKNKGTQFSPRVVEVFIKMKKDEINFNLEN